MSRNRVIVHRDQLRRLIAVLVVRRRFAATVVGIFAVTAMFLPYWTSLDWVRTSVPVIAVVTSVLAAAACFRFRPRITWMDGAMILLCASVALAWVLGLSNGQHALAVLAAWPAAYVLGRALYQESARDLVRNTLATAGLVLAAFAIAEGVFDWHPFTRWLPEASTFAQWSTIQERNGDGRSEWALGHSTALGNVLALLIPSVAALPLRWPLRAGAPVLLLGGIYFSASRNALISGALAVLLVMVSTPLPERLRKWRWHAVAGALLLCAISGAAYLLATADNHEVNYSTDYRLNYFRLLDDVKVLGLADTFRRFGDGSSGFLSTWYPNGVARSVDSTPILLGLQFGWIPVIALSGVAAVVAWVAIKRGPTDAFALGLLAQVPSILTLALITQYAYLIWFCAGAVISLGGSSRRWRLDQDSVSARRIPRHLSREPS